MKKKLIRNYWLYLLGGGFGAIAGFIYWQQIGCNSGTCMITSSPVNSSIYGAVMGALIFSLFKKTNQVT